MDTSKLKELGKPAKESYRDTVLKLTEKVFHITTFKYKSGLMFDKLEEIVKEEVEHYGEFECSKENLGKKIIAVHDVDNKIASLLVGAMPAYRTTVMEKFCNRISKLIYETGMKEEIVEIMFSTILKEMKIRFGNKKSGYVFKGKEGNRDEGVIKKQ